MLRGTAINVRIGVVRHFDGAVTAAPSALLKAAGLATILIGKYALGTGRVDAAMHLLISVLLDSAMLTNK
jgi:hypothetical protein